MFIVMLATECAPVAKVGGLGDVVFGLSRELEIRGNAVEIILPKYDCLRYDHVYDLRKVFDDLWVPYAGGSVHCTVYFGFVHGRKCFFIETHDGRRSFDRGMFYGQPDDADRFALFSKAAMEFMYRSGKQPDVIHCHDWQTGLVPALLFDIYKPIGMHHPRVCYTIHNFKHQGVVGGGVLQSVGLNNLGHYNHPDRFQHPGNPHAINLMKGGIVYSNFVTTVSPHHAFEVRTSDQGHGLGHTLFVHGGKFGGILNGIDYDFWNPEIDSHIPSRYSVDTLDKKYANKDALRDRFWLAKDFKPLIAYIGRLDDQKGVDLIEHAAFHVLSHGCQFVLLGSAPDPKINERFWNLKRRLNDSPNCHIELSFNEELSHLIYAGADMMVVPSKFEPCGLTQMIALRYGTVPVVRNVGGLHDTVFDADHTDRPYDQRNGYVFNDYNIGGINSALDRAIGMWYTYPEYFRELMANGMRYDFSWNHPGQHYLNVYEHIRDK